MRGFVMTEVLVALVLLALALTAVIGLALRGFAATTEARRAEIAANLVADLAGRTRALPEVDWTSLPAPQACGAGCSPEQLAALEFTDWRDRVAEILPAGHGQLDGASSGGLVVTLSWAEPGQAHRELRLGIAR